MAAFWRRRFKAVTPTSYFASYGPQIQADWDLMKRRLKEVFVICCALALKANAQTPVILSQPQSITINNASTATFTVVATNAAKYQWFFGGSSIAGATNSTLTYDDVTTNQAGSYAVEVTSSGGASTNSQPAQLTIVQGTMVQITFSGYADGSSSNVTVQLFDHDKPATVANFLHYITPIVISGVATNLAFTNMIWDRCVPEFVLQGGSYDATDRTNSTPPVQLDAVTQKYSENLEYVPPFPFNVDNEFDDGPLIHNHFATLAMAKTSGNPDSAESAFFFNLVDNSSNLDYQNGGFTVFGRVLSGSNVLQYFNTLSKPNEGIFDSTTVTTNASLASLPVNDDSRGIPANANLFFADFQVLTALHPDTNPPTVQVIYPTSGQTVTNVDVVMQGTAHDDVSLARVVCTVTLGIGIGESSLNATGTTNWSTDLGPLAPGTYNYVVISQDGAGNLATNSITGTFVVPRYPFLASVSGNGSLSTNLNGTNTTVGGQYTITAKPGKGSVFVKWVSGGRATLDPSLNFTMQNGMQAQATFISNTMPHGIAITYPTVRTGVTNPSFSISGTVAPKVGSAQITCQVFYASSGNSVTPPVTVNATNTWSTPLLSLAPGSYVVQAIAQDAGGGATVIYQEFQVLAQLTVVTYGSGHVNIPNGSWLSVGTGYTIAATAAPGQYVYAWDTGVASYTLAAIPFEMVDGLTLTVTFVSNSVPKGITFTSPVANFQVKSTQVTLGGKIEPSLQSPQVVCQVFEDYLPVTGFLPATVTATNWSCVVSNLDVGSYKAVAMATDALGHSTVVSDSFKMNFYDSIAGTYHGLFFNPGNISNTSAGSISFTLSANGIVNGNLTFPHGNYPLHLQMGANGASGGEIYGSLGALELTLIFDVTNLSGQMTGFVTPDSGQIPLTAYRAATKLSTSTAPSPGKYVLSLEPETPTNGILDGPLGTNYAAVNVSANGSLAVAGTLADNTPFSFSTGVFTNGVWPVYASFYKGDGLLIGWETNLPTGVCTGALFWIKGPTNSVYYPDGVQENLNSVGAEYVRPTPGTQYQIIFGGGTLTSPVTNVFSFNSAGAIVPVGAPTDKLTGSLLSTGVLSKGSILNPITSQILKFSGAFVSPSQGGAGFTLDAGTNTGYFEINLTP
jgi:peptidyl-prolyl cis-trans isomerase A (cyclophilin A)